MIDGDAEFLIWGHLGRQLELAQKTRAILNPADEVDRRPSRLDDIRAIDVYSTPRGGSTQGSANEPGRFRKLELDRNPPTAEICRQWNRDLTNHLEAAQVAARTPHSNEFPGTARTFGELQNQVALASLELHDLE